MSLRMYTFALALAVGVSACDRSSPQPMPSAPSPLSSGSVDSSTPPSSAPMSSTASTAPGLLEKVVNIHDDCDPATFNAAVGPGTCVGAGGMRFDLFVALLQKSGVAGPWNFAPNNTTARVGQALVATNRGGETHTFTEVEQFGGGVVPFLNNLAHTPVVAPECQALEADDFVPPGGQYSEEVSETGTVKFQCCIHPWMRFEAHVSK